MPNGVEIRDANQYCPKCENVTRHRVTYRDISLQDKKGRPESGKCTRCGNVLTNS